jgi:hypothetical protein
MKEYVDLNIVLSAKFSVVFALQEYSLLSTIPYVLRYRYSDHTYLRRTKQACQHTRAVMRSNPLFH